MPRIRSRSTYDEIFFFATLFSLVLGPPLYLLYKFNRQKSKSRSFEAALKSNAIPKDERLILYLRSFSGSYAYLWWSRITGAIRLAIRTALNELPGIGSHVSIPLLDRTTENPEISIQRAFSNSATVVAIGDKFLTLGIIKIKPNNDDWQEMFKSLADRVDAIFCQIDSTPASLWEIEQLAKNEVLLNKTFLFLPPGSVKSRYAKTQEACEKIGLQVPEYHHDGWIYLSNSENRWLPYDRLEYLAGNSETPAESYTSQLRCDDCNHERPSLFRDVIRILFRLIVIFLLMGILFGIFEYARR